MVSFNQLFGEFIGTYIFMFVILHSGIISNLTPAIQPFIIVAGLLVAILMFGSLTGGHFNPAVSIMLYAKGGDKNVGTIVGLLVFICAQIVGALVAQFSHKHLYP